MACVFVQQSQPVVWPVSAGASEPAFGAYWRSFVAWHERWQRLYPIANWLALVLLICAAVAYWLGHRPMASVFWGLACAGYVGLSVWLEFSKPSSTGLQ
jgi:hypothetical protein